MTDVLELTGGGACDGERHALRPGSTEWRCLDASTRLVHVYALDGERLV